MRTTSPAGAVIFTGDKERLVRFYQAVTGLSVREADDAVAVLGSDAFQIVIHALPAEPLGQPSRPRDAYVKPFFEVASLAAARELVSSHGGHAEPQSKEWTAGRFRACEAVDPDGNPIQLRQLAP